MSRLSIRPRPLDIHKKLPIVKSVKDFEDEETPTSTRNSQYRITAEAENEVQQIPSKKVASEIPIPQFVVVDTYERDYSCTFTQPTSYLRARGVYLAACANVGKLVSAGLKLSYLNWRYGELNGSVPCNRMEFFGIDSFILEAVYLGYRCQGNLLMHDYTKNFE
ncbi:hypothetical protein TEA_026814 [Camellia sinensis var. sinensis]|uniref:Uncharacterized protein n=1 Tax=Camellia sinensis var. sinensis TaxID=542762 RepID=A0A4V3WNI7_CAMSN|nr:hypothetical protein TEA_026814 [Camellia sinensis var. sinensis]